MIIDRTHYRIRFSAHSALARSFWVSPKGRQREEQFVVSYLTEGDTVVDVGANIGSITFAAASKVGPSGRVISIEPHPRTFRYLLENGGLNQFENMQFYNCAIGSSPGIVHFTDRGDDDQNRVIEAGGIPVEVTTLDDLLRAFGFQVYRVDGKTEEAVAIRDMDEFISRVDGMNLVAVS